MSSNAPRSVELVPFEPTDRGAVQAVEVQLDSTHADYLRLRYVLHADLARIRVPQPRPSRQTDELWKHTCFEIFLRARSGTAYHELNVSPSSEWALYSFDDYRQGMVSASVPQSPAIRVEPSAQRLTVDVRLPLKMLPPSRAVALAAVIEHDGGSLSYWALKHPANRPDFHHPEGFALEL
jgi:hypothetical protein